ncbi:MAG: hypothetical protein C4320_00920 [Armatimonadota bacterium]
MLAGWFFTARGLGQLAKRLGAVAPTERAKAGRGLAVSATVAAVLLLVGTAFVKLAGTTGAPKSAAGILFHLPIVWFVMPWTAWIVVTSVVMIGYRLLQMLGTILPAERQSRLISMAVWAATGVAFTLLFRHDPDSRITILRGAIPLTLSNFVAILIFAGLAVAAMTLSARSLASRGLAKGIGTQAALLAGSFVFGIPFAFLLVTSFKEDKDMTNANGIVWIPKVTREIPYVDPKNTVYEVERDGRKVEATLVERLPNGRAKMEVFSL